MDNANSALVANNEMKQNGKSKNSLVLKYSVNIFIMNNTTFVIKKGLWE